jgi:hypothetical protein
MSTKQQCLRLLLLPLVLFGCFLIYFFKVTLFHLYKNIVKQFTAKSRFIAIFFSYY